MRTFTSALLALGSVSTIANAVDVDFYSDVNCDLFSFTVNVPSEIGCTTFEYPVYGLELRTDIPDGDCLITIFNDASCLGDTVQNFLNGDTEEGK